MPFVVAAVAMVAVVVVSRGVVVGTPPLTVEMLLFLTHTFCRLSLQDNNRKRRWSTCQGVELGK